MTYVTGGPIEALDYNTFATLSGSMNELYADLYLGSTDLPNAGYGYGQAPALSPVVVGDDVLASEWEALFETMRKSGTHQGTAVVPPLPLLNPVSGNLIEAFNTPTAFADLVALLQTNRFNLAAGQSAQVTAASTGTSSPWTTSLGYTFTVNLGTWDQARYFFNSGGWIGIQGSYAGGGEWTSFLNTVGTIQFRATSTSSLVPNSSANNRGLWPLSGIGAPLTTTYQEVFYRIYGGGGYYSNSSLKVEARLGAAAPAVGSGTIQFRVTLLQSDTSPPLNPKTSSTTFTMSETHSAGAISFLSGGGGPGPAAVIITPGSFTLA